MCLGILRFFLRNFLVLKAECYLAVELIVESVLPLTFPLDQLTRAFLLRCANFYGSSLAQSD